MIASKPDRSQTTIAVPNPVLWREFIITQDNIQPMHGIHPTNAIINAVTNTEPNSSFLESKKLKAIFRNIVPSTKARIIMPNIRTRIPIIPRPIIQSIGFIILYHHFIY